MQDLGKARPEGTSKHLHPVDHTYDVIPTPPTVRRASADHVPTDCCAPSKQNVSQSEQLVDEHKSNIQSKEGIQHEEFHQDQQTPWPSDSNLTVGSLIQITDANNTLRFGTIKWIGLISNVQGKIAGIELVRFEVCYP